jgi:hypothetical protein
MSDWRWSWRARADRGGGHEPWAGKWHSIGGAVRQARGWRVRYELEAVWIESEKGERREIPDDHEGVCRRV